MTEYQKGIERCMEIIRKRIERYDYATKNSGSNEELLAPIRKNELESLLNFLALEKYQ